MKILPQGGYDASTSNLEDNLRLIKSWNIEKEEKITSHIILFPFQSSPNHWTLGKINLQFNEHNLSKATIIVYDSLSPSYEIDHTSIIRLENCINKAFESQIKLALIKNKRYMLQQHDGTSCGVITAENGKDFIEGGKDKDRLY